MRAPQAMISILHRRIAQGVLCRGVRSRRAGWVGAALWVLCVAGGWVDPPPAESRLQTAASTQDSPENAERIKAIRALPMFLTVSVILVLVVLVGSYAFSRALRRHGSLARRQPARPTPTDDVWSMHQVPEEESTSADEDER